MFSMYACMCLISHILDVFEIALVPVFKPMQSNIVINPDLLPGLTPWDMGWRLHPVHTWLHILDLWLGPGFKFILESTF